MDDEYAPKYSIELNSAYSREIDAGYNVGLSGKSIDECPYMDEYPLMASKHPVRAYECPGILRQWWRAGWCSGHAKFMKRENI